MNLASENKKLKQEVKRLQAESFIAQTLVRMEGNKRYIEAALKAGLKPDDLPNINFLHSAKDLEKLTTTKDSLLEQIEDTFYSFQHTKTKDLYSDNYQSFLS